jgi:hypothetical protein
MPAEPQSGELTSVDMEIVRLSVAFPSDVFPSAIERATLP